MKKTMATVAVVGITAGLMAACTSPSEDSATTITFWTHTHPPMIEVYDELIAQYEAENPRIDIEYQTIPNNEFNTKMLTALSSGSGPDVINMDDSAIRGDYLPKNLLAPIDADALGAGSDEDVMARYVDGTLAGAMDADGTLYGLPSEFNGTALAVNTAHLAEAGLDLDSTPLQTWDDVAAAGAALADAGRTQAFSFLYLHSGWYSQQLQTLLHQTGGAIADGDESALDSPEVEEAVQLWADLAGGDRSVGDPDLSSREATLPFQDLASGTQSMAIVYPWSMDQIAETNPETYEDLVVVPLPQFDPSTPSSRVYAYYWAVNQASDEQTESWKFVQYLSEHADEFLTGTDFVQPLVGWQESAAAQEIPFIETWSAAYQTGRFDQVTANYSEVQDALTEMINAAVFDRVPVDEAIADADAAVSRILQD